MEKQKKPLLYYFLLAFFIVILLNVFVFPNLYSNQVEGVSYDQFLRDIDSQRIQLVEIKDEEIRYTVLGEEDIIYTTVPMEDANLTERLYASGAKFAASRPGRIPSC